MLARLDSGKDLIGVVIPHNFQSDVEHGQRPAIQLFLDGSRSTHASLAEGYVREIVSGLGGEVSMHRMGLTSLDQQRMLVLEAALRVRFNPNRDEKFFNAINEMLMMLSMLAIALPASALIREREHGTIEQLLVSPIEPWELLLAKIASSTIVLIIGALLATFCLLIPFLDETRVRLRRSRPLGGIQVARSFRAGRIPFSSVSVKQVFAARREKGVVL
jgi:ABC-2 type transport system permease protein